MDANFLFLLHYWPVLLKGTLLTFVLAASVCLLAIPCSLALIAMLRSERALMRILASCSGRLVKATPALVLLVWIYYVLPLFIPLQLTAFSAALVAFTINLTPFLSDSLLAGVRAIHPQQYDVARVMGMSATIAFYRLMLPQAAKNSAPDLASWFITELKLTSLASMIGLGELMHSGNTIISETYLPAEVYTSVAACYVVLILGVEFCFARAFRIEYRRCL